jgi:leucyl aminopeptidase
MTKMEVSVEKRPLDAIDTEALVLFLSEGQKQAKIDEAYPGLFGTEFSGKPLELTLLHRPAGFQAKRVLLAGLGKQERVTPADWRKAAGAAVRHLRARSVREAVLAADSAPAAGAVTEGAILGDYDPDLYKSDKKDAKAMDRVAVAAPGPDVETAVNRGRIIAESQNFARDLVNEPANRLPPMALAQLKPSIPVTALIPAVENMPGSRAQRPGDIVKSLSGKTIEVINTDAEGRLILADALTYAKQLGCTHLVDAATLTGAIVVALGHIHVGLFTNDDALARKLMAASGAEGEKMWQMPLDDDYKEQYLKCAFADLPNVGGRWGGAITAAYFLKEFADPAPWVHLDIAGTAWLDEGKPFLAKGPSGVAVRSLVRLAMEWASL